MINGRNITPNEVHNALLLDEVLVEIFKKLDGNSLKHSSLVCKQWNDIIGSSKEIMKNFVIQVHKIGDKKSNRCHINADATQCAANEITIIDGFNSSHVQSFKLGKRGQEFNFDTMVLLLQQMPRLEKIEIYATLRQLNETTAKRNILPKLKSLKINGKASSIMNLISPKQIIKLELNYHTCPSTECDDLKKFLLQAENLKEFSVYRTCSRLLTSEDKFPFSLKSFNTPNLYAFQEDKVANLNAFLMSQALTLKALTLVLPRLHQSIYLTILNELKNLKVLYFDDANFPKAKSFYNEIKPMPSLTNLYIKGRFPCNAVAKEILKKCPNVKDLLICVESEKDISSESACLKLHRSAYFKIFNDMKCLTALHLDAEELPAWESFYERTSSMQALRKLYLRGSFAFDEAAKGLLGKCPEIEDLIIRFISADQLAYVAKYNQKLKTLGCSGITSLLPKKLKFPELKSIGINSDPKGNTNFLYSLLKCCPKIEVLNMKLFEDQKVFWDLFDIIREETTLRHLKIIGNEEQLRTIKKKMRSNHGKLKMLELILPNFGTNMHYSNCRCYRKFTEEASEIIYFPDLSNNKKLCRKIIL